MRSIYQKLITPVIVLLLFSSLLFLGMNTDFSMILGGIAIFLIGMEFMEGGFKNFSGGVLERILGNFTSNTPKAIATGFVSTAIVQSSSLVSIIVISFLSAELMTLTSAIGVIFGSNIGTTATAWLVSAFGLKIKISAYAMPMIVVGSASMLSKSNTWKGIGSILVGLGIIFLGIGYMKEGFETLKEAINLSEYSMQGYMGVFVFVLVGAIATVVIQSSSATMAIIITALATNQIDYANALALAIGANVGTTVTAVLGALKSNQNGKRLAVAHFIFNMITGFVAIVFIYQLADFVDYSSGFFGISEDNYTMKLALFHTIFNILGVLIVSPFINILVTFLQKLFVKNESIDGKPKYLDRTLVENGELAIIAIKKEVNHLYDNAYKIISHGLGLNRSDIESDEDLDIIIKNPLHDSDINIDKEYQNTIKNLYSEIIAYSTDAQYYMSSEMSKEIYNLKVAVSHMMSVLKDTGELQKNILAYKNSNNSHIHEQYEFLRKNIADILRNIQHIRNTDEEDVIISSLSRIKLHIKSASILSNGKLDDLIRNNLITSYMATSLINDTSYFNDISEHLLQMSELLFIDNYDAISDILLNNTDIEEILQDME